MEIMKQCQSFSEQIGCSKTFDGKCMGMDCQTYNLIEENQELKEEIVRLKEVNLKEVYEFIKKNKLMENICAIMTGKLEKKLEKIKEIIKTEFHERYVALGHFDYDRILEKIEKIIEE